MCELMCAPGMDTYSNVSQSKTSLEGKLAEDVIRYILKINTLGLIPSSSTLKYLLSMSLLE